VKCEKLERERDEAREAFVIATDQMVVAQCKLRESNKERDEAREALREIKAADWKTSGELRGMARKALEDAK
jgi:predicted house-cleaning NTP pyrophosphatase (Maf/HAM1 superfamily)